MRKIFWVSVIPAILATILFTACESNTNTANNAANKSANKPEANRPADNTNRENSNSAVNETNSESNSTDPADEKSGFSLATPTDAYKAAYAARKNKDVKGLKRVLSKDMLEFFGILAEDGKSTIDDQLKSLAEKPQNPSNESRNEKITGNTATLEYLNEKGEWKSMDFIKESDGWKLTINKDR